MHYIINLVNNDYGNPSTNALQHRIQLERPWQNTPEHHVIDSHLLYDEFINRVNKDGRM